VQVDLHLFNLPFTGGPGKNVPEEIAKFQEEQEMKKVMSVESIEKNERAIPGKKEGFIDGMVLGAVILLQKGVDIDTIVKYTCLPRKDIVDLATSLHKYIEEVRRKAEEEE
jgi:hypothetical protein